MGEPGLGRAAYIQAAVAVAVAIGDPRAGAFVATRAYLARNIGFHEYLHDSLRGLTEDIGVTGSGQPVCQRYSVLGHRVRLKLRNAISAADPVTNSDPAAGAASTHAEKNV